ncbi:MAG TPA: alpha/beta hydrolase [Candidatus Solibacter sp.]|nr:alpha/beta hydrolase [Candidatus Solibacter sp.]
MARAKIYDMIEKAGPLLSSLAVLSLFALSLSGRASLISAERNSASLQAEQKKAVKTSESQTPNDPQMQKVLGRMVAADVARPTTVEDVRRAYLFYPKLSGSPEHVFRIADRQIPGPAGNIGVRIYTPSATTGLPIFVFFHGGGFVAGSIDTYDTPLRSVSNGCECIVVSVAYRLAPENKYPAAPEDAYAATKWVAEHGSELGGDADRIAVGGDGAGGNLAAVVTLMARDNNAPRLIFQVLIYPTLDASTLRPVWWEETNAPTVTRELKNEILSYYLPVTGNLRDPHVAPLHAENLKHLPKALVISYEDNPMHDEGDEYATRLRQDGVVTRVSFYPDTIHGFFLMAGELDAGRKCVGEIASALRDAFKSTKQALQ